MAQATVTTRQERKIVQQLVDVETVTLELSQKEASVLHFILACIGGSPTDSPRLHTSSIKGALALAGVNSRMLTKECLNHMPDVGKSLYFKGSADFDYAELLKKED